MFKEFFKLEVRNHLTQPMVYIFFLVVALMVFGAVVSDNIIIGSDTGNINKNAPFVIGQYTVIIGLIGIVMITAFMNNAALRDFNYNYEQILFSTPIRKNAYLLGRFLGAYLVAILPFLGVFAGILIGVQMPFMNEAKVGPFIAEAYINSLLTFIIPNTFILGAIIFALAVRFRNTVVSFIGAIVVLVLYIMSQGLIGDLDNENLAIMLDPLGVRAYSLVTKYWTVAEKNTQPIALEGWLLFNRLLWMSVGLLAFLSAYFSFSFDKKKKVTRKKLETEESPAVSFFENLNALPKVQVTHNRRAEWQQFFNQVKVEFIGTIKSVPFIVLLFTGLVNLMPSLLYVTEYAGDSISYPVTYSVIGTIKGSLYLFVFAIIIYYSGALIWKEKDARMNEFYDAYAYPDWVMLFAKFVALVGLVAIIQLLGIFSGVVVQLSHGYTRLQLDFYFTELILIGMASFSMMIALSMLVHVLVNNKYLGYFAIVAWLIVQDFVLADAFDINHNLILPAETPSHTYSDMNGYGPFVPGLFWFNVYWLLFFALMLIIALLFWPRGKESGFKNRLKIAKRRFSPSIRKTTAGIATAWVLVGGFIFYNTNILNDYLNPEEVKEMRAGYEKQYKKYEDVPQPRITDVNYQIDLRPEERDVFARVEMMVKNKSEEAIDSIHLTLPGAAIKIQSLEMNRKAELVVDDKALDYRIYHLAEPLLPGESLQMNLESAMVSKGFENEVSYTSITENGSFFNGNDIIPTIGYSHHRELKSKDDREDYDLPERPRMASIENKEARMNTYITTDADWINMETTISTSPDQIAVAPGKLIKEWEDDGRKYFHYKLDKKVLNFVSFISARYEVAREKWNGVDVEVYYHPEHAYNVDRMVDAIKKSLTYYSENFSPYPHEQARIIEFPRYASFAQAFPGTMPYSEAIGFIENLEDEESKDRVFHTVAHEMAHQWWAHQVVGGNVQGATMLSETMSQYASLMVMDEHKDEEHTLEYLRYEMDRYLRLRGSEREKEVPLVLVENMPYIHYQKGSVILYALREFMGENPLNRALKKYAEAVSYQEPPYTISTELLDFVKAEAPDSLDTFIADMFENITLYSNRASEVTYRSLPDGKYEVQLDVTSEKFYADSLGAESQVQPNDWIEIGVYAEDEAGEEELIYLERKQIKREEQSFTIVVDREPVKAGIDPRNLLIDRVPGDNVKKADRAEEA